MNNERRKGEGTECGIKKKVKIPNFGFISFFFEKGAFGVARIWESVARMMRERRQPE